MRKARLVNDMVVEVFDPVPPLTPDITDALIECGPEVQPGYYYFDPDFVEGPDPSIRMPVWNGASWITGETQAQIDAWEEQQERLQRLKDQLTDMTQAQINTWVDNNTAKAGLKRALALLKDIVESG